VFAAVLATAGCAPSLEIGRPAAPLPARFEAAALHPDPEPAALDRWWTLFGDAQLDDLVARALRANADVRLGLARLREAQAIRQAALAPYRVQGDLQVTGGVQRSESLSGPDVLIGGPSGTAVTSGATVLAASPTFNLSWELDLLGRRGVAREAADADLAAARFVQEGTRATLAADVADALFAARGLVVEPAQNEPFDFAAKLATLRPVGEGGHAEDAPHSNLEPISPEPPAPGSFWSSFKTTFSSSSPVLIRRT